MKCYTNNVIVCEFPWNKKIKPDGFIFLVLPRDSSMFVVKQIYLVSEMSCILFANEYCSSDCLQTIVCGAHTPCEYKKTKPKGFIFLVLPRRLELLIPP